jgi:DNA-binding NarL/FixJ family response regulator
MNERCVVLLVKNNPRIFNTCRRTLEQEGIKVLTVDTFVEVVERVAGAASDTPPPSALLTKKELAIATLVAANFSNGEIAEQLYLSESRVKTCLTEIYRKLGFSGKKNKRNKLMAALNREQ